MLKRRLTALALSAGLLAALRGAASAASCVGGTQVFNVPGTYGTIQQAIDTIPPGALTQDYCIQIGAGTYPENLFIGNHPAAGFQIVISTAAGAGGAVFVSPTGGLNVPIFDIRNDSVTLIGLGIRPGGVSAANYGVFEATASAVAISSCVVDESGGYPFSASPGEIANFTNVNYSTFSTVQTNPGLVINGSNNTVQFSYVASKDTTGQGTFAMPGGSNNNYVYQSFLNNTGTSGGLNQNGASVGSNGNVFALSTIQTSGPDFNSSAIYIPGTGNVISTVTVISTTAGGGYGVYWTGNGNFIYGSTVSSAGSEPLYIASNGNYVSGSAFVDVGGPSIGGSAVQINAAANNQIFTSTMTAFNSTVAGTLFVQGAGASNNFFSQIYVNGPGTSIELSGAGVTSTTIQFSTVTNTAWANGAATTTFTNDSLLGFNAVLANNGADYTTVYNSQLTGIAANGDTVFCSNATHCSIVSSLVSQPLGGLGGAIHLQPGNYSNVEFSTVTLTGGGGTAPAVSFDGTVGSTMTGSVVQSLGGGDGLWIGNSASGNLVSFSTMTAANAATHGLTMTGGAYANQIVGGYLANSVGGAAFITGNLTSQDTLQGCTLATSGSGVGSAALSITSSSTSTIRQCSLQSTNGAGGYGLFMSAASSITVVGSTITAANGAVGFAAAYMNTATNNAITGSVIKNSAGRALWLDTPSSLIVVNSTTMTASGFALYIPGGTNNTINGSYAFSSGSTAIELENNANNNTILNSTAATSAAADALYIGNGAGSNFNTVTGSDLYGGNVGNALYVELGSHDNAISFSTITSRGAPNAAAYFTNSAASNTLTNDYIEETGASPALIFNSGSHNGTVTSVRMYVNNAGNAYGVTQGGGPLPYLNAVSLSSITNQGGPAAVLQQGSNDSIVGSTITALGGHPGIQLLTELNGVVDGDLIQASTAVLVLGSTNVFVTGDVLDAGIGAPGDALFIGGGGPGSGAGAPVTVGSITTNNVPSSANYALIDNAIGPLNITGYLVLRGTFQVAGVTINEGNYSHVFGGGVYLAGATGWTNGADQIAIDGANDAPPAPTQTVRFPSGAQIGTLTLNDAVVFMTNAGALTAAAFSDARPASKVFFQNTPGPSFTFNSFAVGGSPGNPITLKSTLNGTPWSLAVNLSSVTQATVIDSNASGGNTVEANDGTVTDGGNNTNWGFLPQLYVQLPGQAWTEGAGFAGVPSAQVAGAPFAVTVRAVSYSSTTVQTATLTPTLTGSDPFLSPANGTPSMTQPLASGVTTFSNVTASSAEPAGLPVVFNASAPGAIASYADAAPLNPGPFNHLQVLIPSEQPTAGSTANGGIRNIPDVQVTSRPIASILVRAVDAFNNVEPGVSDVVAIIGTNSSTATWQSAGQALSLGTTIFTSTFTFYSTGTFNLTVHDVTNGLIPNVNSSNLLVTMISLSSPTVALNINQSTVTTLGGGLSGYAFDSQAVSKVLASLQSASNSLYYTFPSSGIGTFTSGPPVFATATIQGQGAYVNWSVPLSDNALSNKTSYYVQMRAVDGSNNVTVAFSSFTFLPGRLSVGTAGEGTALLIPAVSSGCEPVLLTVNYTVGPAGLQPGGKVSVTLPPGWTGPTTVGGANPPAPGQAFIGSSNGPALAGGSAQCQSGQAQAAGASLCTVAASGPAFNAGDTISFVLSALPPIGPTGRGQQLLNVQSQADGTGQLAGIGAQPAMTLNQGTTAYFAFADPSPLTVGPLQTSATMQLAMIDLCGNPVSTNVVTTATITIQGNNQFGVGVDTNAVIYATSTAGGVIVSSVTFWPFHSFSNAFYYETSTSGVNYETIHATGNALGVFAANYSEANRSVTLLVSSLTFSAISIDSGTVNASQNTTAITYSGAAVPAYIRFTPSVGGAPWSVLISSDPVAFSPAVYQNGGQTTANQPVNVSWTGLNTLANPPQFAPASTYYVLLRGAFGAVQDTSLKVVIPQSPYIAGNLGPRGAGALVSVAGPGAGFGNQGVATSTGYFQVFGLLDQQYYAVQASTSILVAGQSVTLTTGSIGVQALAAGDLIPGTLSFPTTAFLQVSVTLPQPAPYEFSGGVKVFNSSGSPAAVGNLHFYAGSGTSDNGAQAYGQSASTWTTMLVTPDTYTVVVDMPDLRISTQIASVLVNQFSTVGLPFVFQKKSNVYGFVTIPSTTPFGAAVSVSGQLVGVSSPSVFASAFVQPWSNGFNYSSAPYSLYGLDPGTWTITAKSELFLSTSSVVVISSNADVGDATFLTSGFALPLSSGGVIAGTVTINGDTTQQSQCISAQDGVCPAGVFEVAVQAYNQRTFQTAIVPIRLVKSPAQTSSTFTLAGLASGSYVVQAALGGWSLSPQGGQVVIVSTPAVSTSSLTLNAGSVSTSLNIKLPANPSGGCHPATDAHNVGIWGPIYGGGGGHDLGYPDVVESEVSNSTVAIYCSSMTVTIPPQNGGFETIRVTYNPTGASAQQVLAPVQGAATTLNFDLSQPTVTVSGKVTFSGVANLAFSTYSVSVSTLGGILQAAPTNYFCVIDATSTIPVSTLHLELIPLDPQGQGTVPPLRDNGAPFASGASSCNPQTASGGIAGLLGYVAQIQADGTFSFPGVSPGVYRLRNYANLDLNPARGAEIGFFEQDLAVTTNTTNLLIPISQGFNVSGLLSLPPGLTTSRTFQLSLVDNHGNPVAQVPATFNGNNAVPFSFGNVGGGEYSINVLDFGLPYSYVAAPLTVRVVGASLVNQNIQLLPAGTIRANLAIQQTLSDGSKQFISVTHSNGNLLPDGLLVDAIATPWIQGGYFRAQSANCSSPLNCFGTNPGSLTIDPNTDQMTIIGLLPGIYNVEFIVPQGVSAGSTGGLSLVSTVRSGVTVGPGQTIDLGVVGLTAGVALSGRVTDVATSTPLAGIRLLARPSIAQSGQVSARAGFTLAFTDQNGAYSFSGLDPGVRYYDIFAANRTSGQQGDVVAPYEQQITKLVDIVSTSTLNFALSFASYSVAGRVVGRPGDQLVSGVGQSQGASPGATIMIQKFGVAPTANPIADIVLQTDAQGNFTLPALTAGKYVLYAMALNYQTYTTGVTITNSSLSLGTLQLTQGATLSGSIRKVDGTAPSEDDVQTVVGAATDFSDYFFGLLTRDPQTRGITGYTLSGFKPGTHYRVIFVSVDHELAVPPEVSNVVFASSDEARGVDATFTPQKPFVGAKASAGPNGAIKIALHVSQPCRERLIGDDNLTVMLTTYTAQGFVSSVTISVDRRELDALYTPGVNESSFTLKLSAYSATKDPFSTDPINPEFVIFSTPTFYLGTDGASNLNINNVEGGGLEMEGDQGHVTLPKGAFSVDVSSGLSVVFQKSNDNLSAAKLSAASVPTVQANINALRYKPAAYPSTLFQAMASLPPSVSPFSAFYDILLPLGVRTALAQPVQLTVAYSTSTGVDPTKLNVYWFNAAANAYVLQQDVTGAPPVIDTVNHTITINVNHFSTFVLFNAGVNVITGASFGGTDITAYNFPNPFDLSDKTVTSIHPGAGGAQNTIRGTMISIGLPPDVSGEGSLKIYNVAGEKVRAMDLGSLAGGAYYYQPWDGRNDSGRDVASGVYIGMVKVGGKTKFFKMALIK